MSEIAASKRAATLSKTPSRVKACDGGRSGRRGLRQPRRAMGINRFATGLP